MTNTRSGVRSTQMRYLCWNLVSTPRANSDGYPILKTVLGSKRVRGRKNRKKARNHAVRNAVTAAHTRRRRRRSISVLEGPVDVNPAAAAAFEVPTAGVPTYLVASTFVPSPAAAAGFAASGFGTGFAPSGSGMSTPPDGFDPSLAESWPGFARRTAEGGCSHIQSAAI